jgi:alpha-aminoadipic semialdehyde synthase
MMGHRIGLRREDMYQWERRVPLVPDDLHVLSESDGLSFRVQSSERRAFTDAEYREVGLDVVEDLTGCPVVIGLKEIPVGVLQANTAYVFFSHTIKGQPANMPMLQRCLDLGSTIIDYERIVDDNDSRLIFFGNYAGLAGAIDTLWTLGRRLAWEGIDTPLSEIRQASTYADLPEAKAAVAAVGERIAADGMPESISPLVIGVAGYGNVSKGAQQILDILPIEEVTAADLLAGNVSPGAVILKVVFREEDTVTRLDPGVPFALQEYYDHPERYRGVFPQYLPKLHALINCVYWEPKYPRLVGRADVRALYADGQPTLRVIGDISCDVEGSIEVTVKATEPNDPIYVYDPESGEIQSGVEGTGPVMMTVEILPSELPRESSEYFSDILKGFVPAIAAADYGVPFQDLALPPELKRAVICHRGELAPDYRGLEKHLGAAA